MAQVICDLYDDPIDGFPRSYARDGSPALGGYPVGQTLPPRKVIGLPPSHLVGSVSGELGRLAPITNGDFS